MKKLAKSTFSRLAFESQGNPQGYVKLRKGTGPPLPKER